MDVRCIKLCAVVFLFFFSCVACVSSVDDLPTCEKWQDEVKTKLKQEETMTKFVTRVDFSNDTKPLLVMTWAGKSTLIVVTMRTTGLATSESDVYRSTDDGRTFTRITEHVAGTGQPLLVMQTNGLQRNSAEPSRVYLSCYNPNRLTTSLLYYTTDGGASWARSELDFPVKSPFQFHPKQPDWLLTQSGSEAFVSRNNGKDWTRLSDSVFKASWGVSECDVNAVYMALNADSVDSFLGSLLRDRQQPQRRTTGRRLVKSTDFSSNLVQLADNIYSFSNKGEFVFISKADADRTDYRHLEVSKTCSATFSAVQLPSASPDRFFAILDMSEGLAFVHMDDGNFHGYGTLYTSDDLGRVFSKSLERHLYPPVGSSSDFYKVESMRGTYMTTVMSSNGTMYSVITHNRGAIWRHLYYNATDYLQVASQYSISRGVPADPPLSVPSAAGLLLVHGHAAEKLQSGKSTVYVSSDGGYSWYKALDGQHSLQIGNNGNFLVAMNSSHNLVKFSTDAGRCWYTHQFTNEPYVFTGLLTEPGNRALTVAIWGYIPGTRHWRVFVLDLGQLLTQKCADTDYEPWLASGVGADSRDCVFGARETIMRLKSGSMCASEYSHRPSSTKQPCNCTKEDFECEFGYTRSVNSLDCVRDPDVKDLKVCDADTVKEIVTEGYRKLPGNLCVGGFHPNVTTESVLKSDFCPKPTEDSRVRDGRLLMKQLHDEEAEAAAAKWRHTVGIIVPLSLTVLGLLCLVVGLVVMAKLRERRRRQLAFHYSAVSSAGRRADLEGGGPLQYQPADGILNGAGPRPLKYSGGTVPSRPAAIAPLHKHEHKQPLMGDEDEDPIS